MQTQPTSNSRCIKSTHRHLSRRYSRQLLTISCMEDIYLFHRGSMGWFRIFNAHFRSAFSPGGGCMFLSRGVLGNGTTFLWSEKRQNKVAAGFASFHSEWPARTWGAVAKDRYVHGLCTEVNSLLFFASPSSCRLCNCFQTKLVCSLFLPWA